MNDFRLASPKMMDVAVPANMRQGLAQEYIARRGWAYSAEEASALLGKRDVTVIDLREKCERERDGEIPGALHLPYTDLRKNISPAVCCVCSPRSLARSCCSTAPTANAPRWRCRPPGRRTQLRLSHPGRCQCLAGSGRCARLERPSRANVQVPSRRSRRVR